MLDPVVLWELETVVGADRVLTLNEDLTAYSYDGIHLEGWPDVVVLPSDTIQLVGIVRVAHADRVPIVPGGRGQVCSVTPICLAASHTV